MITLPLVDGVSDEKNIRHLSKKLYDCQATGADVEAVCNLVCMRVIKSIIMKTSSSPLPLPACTSKCVSSQDFQDAMDEYFQV